MKTIKFLILFSVLITSGAFAQEFYEDPGYQDPIMEDEGSFNSELQAPVDDYYLSEELERQEDYEFQEAPPEDWSLEGEELPVDEYDGY